MRGGYSCGISFPTFERGGGVLLTEMLLPRIARQGTYSIRSTRGQARNTRIDQFELDEGFQQYHTPFRNMDSYIHGARHPPKHGSEQRYPNGSLHSSAGYSDLRPGLE